MTTKYFEGEAREDDGGIAHIWSRPSYLLNHKSTLLYNRLGIIHKWRHADSDFQILEAPFVKTKLLFNFQLQK